MKNIYITFDVDMCDYLNTSWTMIDEFKNCFPKIKDILRKYENLKTTWFVRIDNNIKEIYNSQEYIFDKYDSEILWLKENGHEVAWHFHSYAKKNGMWTQNIDEETLVEELKQNAENAINLGLKTVRMGWAYQTNKTIKALDDIGFVVDSSAIPRPQYCWDKLIKDWSITPQGKYYPSSMDYRVEGRDNLNILELPMTTTHIKTSYDSQNDILRYINPAYNAKTFQQAINQVKELNDIVLISHPYEIVDEYRKNHELLAFSIDAFEENIKYIYNDFIFKTVLEAKEM